jgi:hypothetical protein
LILTAGAGASQAQDWNDYLHWPYTPPQNPGSGSQANALYDGWYVHPREKRVVPQIQGPYYRNFYGGKRILGHRVPHFLHEWNNKPYYQGYHYFLDVF